MSIDNNERTSCHYLFKWKNRYSRSVSKKRIKTNKPHVPSIILIKAGSSTLWAQRKVNKKTSKKIPGTGIQYNKLHHLPPPFLHIFHLKKNAPNFLILVQYKKLAYW